MKISTITLFPEIFTSWSKEGVVGRAFKEGLCQWECVHLRSFANNKHGTVDDRPYGGGDGMVLKADVSQRALNSIITDTSTVIHVTPAAPVFDHQWAKKLAHTLENKKHLIFLSGRYAGFDNRFVQKYAHHHLSLGDFVMSGGELAVCCFVDAIVRLLPGALGNPQSSQCDSFVDGLLEAPPYTHPAQWEGQGVPEVLLSGDHGRIDRYQYREKLRTTALYRPDLIMRFWERLKPSDKKYIESLWKHGPHLEP